ncbi:MAG: hypothetical protein F4149_12475 [Gammaproteobacteria bacterium]|nr:hypothetical protein [Gammaproteobacteria bacterium]
MSWPTAPVAARLGRGLVPGHSNGKPNPAAVTAEPLSQARGLGHSRDPVADGSRGSPNTGASGEMSVNAAQLARSAIAAGVIATTAPSPSWSPFERRIRVPPTAVGFSADVRPPKRGGFGSSRVGIGENGD